MSKEVGAAIRMAREDRGWSQEALAHRVGTTQSTIDRIESGATRRSRVLPEIAAELGIVLPGFVKSDPPLVDKQTPRSFRAVHCNLPSDLIDRIEYYRQSIGHETFDQSIIRLIEHSLDLRDDAFRITDRIMLHLEKTKSLREAAGQVLSYHPMVKFIQFEGDTLHFGLQDGSSSEISEAGTAILRDSTGEYCCFRQSAAPPWLSELNFIKPDYPIGKFDKPPE